VIDHGRVAGNVTRVVIIINRRIKSLVEIFADDGSQGLGAQTGGRAASSSR
jgi:hypothetical protein